MIKRYPSSIFQAALLLGCLFVLGCENDEKTLDDWTKKTVMVEKARNVNSLFSQDGKLRANLTAPLMLRYQTDSLLTVFPESLHVVFFDSATKVESWLDAKYGKYLESYNRVLLRDSVRVINVNGDTLTTAELWWDQNEKKFYTDSIVRIITVDKRIRGGKGLEAGQDLSWYTIKYPTGTVLVGDDVLAQ